MDEVGIKRGYDEIFADSAEPKSIAEIYAYNFNIKPCPKGADSVEFGHQKVRQYKQYWTKSSTNCIKEQRNFRYIPDKDGKLTDKTTHQFSHGMDSRRYALIGYLNRRDYGFGFPEDKVEVLNGS
jgi:phage terminase large subunit